MYRTYTHIWFDQNQPWMLSSGYSVLVALTCLSSAFNHVTMNLDSLVGVCGMFLGAAGMLVKMLRSSLHLGFVYLTYISQHLEEGNQPTCRGFSMVTTQLTITHSEVSLEVKFSSLQHDLYKQPGFFGSLPTLKVLGKIRANSWLKNAKKI